MAWNCIVQPLSGRGQETEPTEQDDRRLLPDESFVPFTVQVVRGTMESLRTEKDPDGERYRLRLRGMRTLQQEETHLRDWSTYEHKQLLGRWISQFQQYVRVGTLSISNSFLMVDLVDDPSKRSRRAVSLEYHTRLAVDAPTGLVVPFRQHMFREVYREGCDITRREAARKKHGTHAMGPAHSAMAMLLTQAAQMDTGEMPAGHHQHGFSEAITGKTPNEARQGEARARVAAKRARQNDRRSEEERLSSIKRKSEQSIQSSSGTPRTSMSRYLQISTP